jgi:hypothetical protein
MKANDKIVFKNKYIHIVEVLNGWVTFHIYYGMQVWVKKMTTDKFQKLYLKERYEQTSLF